MSSKTCANCHKSFHYLSRMDYDVSGPPPYCDDCKKLRSPQAQRASVPNTSDDQQIAGLIILGSLIGSFARWSFGLLSSLQQPKIQLEAVTQAPAESLTTEQADELNQELKVLRSNLKTVTFAEEAKLQWESIEKILKLKPQHKKPFAVVAIVTAVCVAPVAFMALPVIALAIFAGAKKRESEINSETQEKITIATGKLNT